MTKYEEIVAALKEYRTLSAHITKLGNMVAKTEDQQLVNLLNKVVLGLRTMHANATAAKVKVKGLSTPGNIYDMPGTEIKSLIQYCESIIVSRKPEWQILAERHGWAPSQS